MAWYGVLMMSYVFIPNWKAAIRDRTIQTLRAEFGGDVRFQSFDVSLWPRVHVAARGVLLGNTPSSPLVQAATVDAWSRWTAPWHIGTVVVRGLSLRIPTAPGAANGAPKPAPPIEVDEIVSEHAQVDILPSAGQAPPLHFELGQFRVTNFSPSRAADFTATVVTSQPRADIQTTGRVGPWNAQAPSHTELAGSYTISRCDLSGISGLKGILSSHGRFQGPLQRMQIQGDADVPQFSLSLSGRPESLHANFQAAADASDGMGFLQSLNGMLGSSSFTGSGLALNFPDDSKRDIALDLSFANGRLEDILPLAVKSATSPITGPFRVRATIEIPPGHQDMVNRFSLSDDFAASQARFSSLDLRNRLRDVSRKAEGHPNNESSGSSISSMQGHLRLNNGVAEFSDLVFDLEGATARLSGSYQLASERLDLRGQLWMDASLSQTATGVKAIILKAVEPFFRSKHGGSVVPIKISGTRSDPEFALDVLK